MNIENLRSIADKGVAWAQGRLGAYYVNGSEGLIPSAELGHEYLVKAAMQGHKQALYDAGHMFLEGIGCIADSDNGLHFLTEAAKKYHTDAFLRLAKYSMTTLKNYEMAYYYYLLYMGCADSHENEDKETLSLISDLLDVEIAKSTYKEAEELINNKPLQSVEMLDYSGVYVKISQNEKNDSEISLATDDEYFPIALDAAHELIEQLTT